MGGNNGGPAMVGGASTHNLSGTSVSERCDGVSARSRRVSCELDGMCRADWERRRSGVPRPSREPLDYGEVEGGPPVLEVRRMVARAAAKADQEWALGLGLEVISAACQVPLRVPAGVP
jgi:hypothetical protein